MKFFAVLLVLSVAGVFVGAEDSGVGGDAQVSGGMWGRFQRFFKTVWLPFVEERLMRVRPPPQDVAASARKIEEYDSFDLEQPRDIKFTKINVPGTRYTETALYNLRGGLAWGPFQPRVATATLTTLVDTVATNALAGTLRLFQPTVFSDVTVNGVISGLLPSEVINIHVRTRGDVTANCANQGDLYNPSLSPSGNGGNIGTFTANGAGVVTVDVGKINPVNVDMFENSVIGRSIRVSRTNNAGLPRACGVIGF